MKKRKKLLLTSIVVVAVVCLIGIILDLRQRRSAYKPNPIRPKDFPKILVAPEGAISLDHSAPSDSPRAPHTYSLSFIVPDPYPSEATQKFIKEHLTSNGWQRLNYHLLNPDKPLSKESLSLWFGSSDPNFVPPEEQEGNRPLQWMEDWVSKNDENISVILSYLNPAKKEVHRDKVFVNLSFFGRKSWVRPYILKYKELHPEEFDESTTVNRPDR